MPSIHLRPEYTEFLTSRGAFHSVSRHSCPWKGMLALCLGLAVMSRPSGASSGEKAPGETAKTAVAKGASADAGGAQSPLADPTPVDDGEVKLGRMNAEENDRQVKLITDSKILERVNRIGSELARIANNYPIPASWGSSQLKPFRYTFKVVDDKDVNAYSLPGGFIYVHKGLIDAVRSDDELAGVLAHEIAHAAHHHVLKLLREQRPRSSYRHDYKRSVHVLCAVYKWSQSLDNAPSGNHSQSCFSSGQSSLRRASFICVNHHLPSYPPHHPRDCDGCLRDWIMRPSCGISRCRGCPKGLSNRSKALSRRLRSHKPQRTPA